MFCWVDKRWIVLLTYILKKDDDVNNNDSSDNDVDDGVMTIRITIVSIVVILLSLFINTPIPD
jgi:hypothetical protein